MKSEDYEPITKMMKMNKMKVEGKGWNMMKNMGWEGTGLGAQLQGLQEPIKATTHSSRHGLGLKDEDMGIEPPKTVWEYGMDEASASKDIVSTIQGCRTYFDDSDLHSGKVIGSRKDTLENEHTFCDPDLLIEMLKCKTVLDKYSNFLDARERSNPYEKIGKGFFMNRAAMKMANLDYLSQYLLTKVEDNQTLFFADICAGPGGFTEYMLWRRPLQSCGFGFTLRGKDDFKLKQILAGPVECFHPSYGKADDGDVTNEENLRKFQSEVFQGTGSNGVHTVLADGGFDVTGKESIQELLSKQLYLCQFLCAINILKIGGNFVCKLFDTFTDFSVGLIHLMSTLFSQLSIVKPITSRPANSERYVIFQNFTSQSGRIEEIRKYLYEVNADLHSLKGTDQDVLRVIPHNVLKRDKQFYQFFKDINNKILKEQIIALAKLHKFIEDPNLIDNRQMDIREEALELWKVPEKKRDHFICEKATPAFLNFVNLNHKNRLEKLNGPAQKLISSLKKEDFLKDKFVIRNHYAAFLGPPASQEMSESLCLVVKDKKHVNWYSNNKITPNHLSEILKKWTLSIPSFTILLVNFGLEYSGPKGNIKYNTVVIIDSPMIFNTDISELPYEDRMHKITHLCSLLDPKLKGIIRPVDYFPLSDIKSFVSRHISLKKAKSVGEQSMVTCRKSDRFYPPSKLVIINSINDPWVIAISKSRGYTYYYNAISHESVVKKPQNLDASYVRSNIYELIWENEKQEFDCQMMLSLIERKY